MKILMISPYKIWPVNYGGAVRTFNIARALAGFGHDVYLLSANPVPESFNMFNWCGYKGGSRVSYFLNQKFLMEFRKLLSDKPDIVIQEFPYQSFMTVPLCRKAGVPLIYDAHNVEAYRFEKIGGLISKNLVRWSEKYLYQNASCTICVSNDDGELMKRMFGPGDIRVIENGVDLEKFTPADIDGRLSEKYELDGKKVVLYFGAYDYPPNREAAEYLVNEVWPEVIKSDPTARLMIVGRNPPSVLTGKEGVIVTGSVEDIVAHIRLADIVAVPLTSGGGTRLKIIEALGVGKTVVSTPFGAAGLTTSESRALILVEKEHFRDRLIGLLSDVSGLDRTDDARKLAKNYDWSTLVQNIEWKECASRGT